MSKASFSGQVYGKVWLSYVRVQGILSFHLQQTRTSVKREYNSYLKDKGGDNQCSLHLPLPKGLELGHSQCSTRGDCEQKRTRGDVFVHGC